MNILRDLLKDEKGQALSEYGLVLGIVVIAVIAALTLLKTRLTDLFEKITDALK